MTRRVDDLSDAGLEVMHTLRDYADRGIFRGFGWSRVRSGTEFSFLWHAPEATRLCLLDRPSNRPRSEGASKDGDHTGVAIVLPELLPQVAFPSTMDRSFREFLKGRQAACLPDHRRIDPARATLKARNRSGNLGIELTSLDGDLVYLTRKTVALVNEVFHSFLAGPYEDYMVRVFNAPEE